MQANNPFIALEGCDGVGKSSIRDVLRDGLVRSGITCMMVGQHSWLNPRVGRLIAHVRELRKPYEPEAIAEAYFIDKRLHARGTVQAALRQSAVLADRYIMSDAVYEEVLYDIPAEDTLERHRSAGTLFPTVVIYVDVEAEEAYRRVLARNKQTRHYERPAEMSRIMAVYRRVLFEAPKPWMPPVLRFYNDRPDWRSRVDAELLPAVLDALSSATGSS